MARRQNRPEAPARHRSRPATDVDDAAVVQPAVPLAGRLVVPHHRPLTGDQHVTCSTLDLRDGCYAFSFRPRHSPITYRGTLRVDRSDPAGGPDGLIASGDLYAVPRSPDNDAEPAAAHDHPAAQPLSAAAAASSAVLGRDIGVAPAADRRDGARIPIYPRDRYSSYLAVTDLRATAEGDHDCLLTVVADQFDYTQPAPGSFTGSFPAVPSRTVELRLAGSDRHSHGRGPRFHGRWLESGVDRGSVSLTWVSRFFRRAVVEIDVLDGAVAPGPVPDGVGGTEFFDTVYAKHGWQLTVVSDQTGVPVPAGVDSHACWNPADLHALMIANRKPTTDLDRQWRIHLMVVPATLGCGRGIMYDTIDVPREGCASFCDDGYPAAESADFGTATDHRQREVPRAFLRSATHEITHTLNQIHQEQETAADNSIMTTTPSVADVLGGPTTGDPGVFPDQINLAVNVMVRQHLNHMPDPVIRPGGWPFASWFGAGVPQAADRQHFSAGELALTAAAAADRLAFGQPLDLSWTLTNTGDLDLVVPNDVRLEGLFAAVTVTDARGRQRPFRPYVIRCETVALRPMAPGNSVSASARIFWSTEGFAFPQPGHYRVTVAVTWSADGIPVGVSTDHDVFVDFPTSDVDNLAAGLVMHPEVGKWVALGGGAHHLTEASRRLRELAAIPGGADAAPRLLAGYRGLLPSAAPGRRPPTRR
jgi:hypothetical protein